MTYKTNSKEVLLYKGRKLAFTLGEKIGRGGNGTVYRISCEPSSSEELVVKILNSSNYKNKPYSPKKYSRFKIEVEQGEKISKLNSCFLNIIDYNLPNIPGENNKPWFVMPFAASFKKKILTSNLSLEKKISLIIEIGNAIKVLHDNGYAHRDIKLDNILIYQNKTVLCDFGLIRHNSLERLTDLNEPIGPWNTIAPEMK
ncbi:protein kinase domain-containing protein [Bacillus basilensis]|uniref:protein kinase domain-containing protein n=1 Tax=Bacillus basilensis TaxID=3243721 RepID=UPI003D6502FD